MAYKSGEVMRLSEVKNLGINPNAILDIGAHTGQFYGWAKPVWSDSVIWMIEANELHESILRNLTHNNNDEYLITALGDKEREVTFYTRSDKPHTEGNSYYQESNWWDIPQLIQESKVKLQTLDDLFTDDTTFEIIKVDTQGSELDILRGGENLCKRASAIILEVSYIEYNKGAPTSDEIIDFMKEFGFEEKMSIGEHYLEGDIVQKDLVFLNKKLDLNS